MATVLEAGKAEDFNDIPIIGQEEIKAQEFETETTDERLYTVERFNGKREHDELLEKRGRILDKMMREPLPDEFVLDVENVVARRLQEQDDKPELAQSSAFDRLVAANLPPDNKGQSEWEKLVLGLRRDKAAGGQSKSVDDIFAETQTMGGREKLERLRALKTFGLAARSVDTFGDNEEARRQAAIAGELIKLRANIVETDLAIDSPNLSARQKATIAADYEDLFADYARSDYLPIRLKKELLDSAKELRIFLEQATAKKADTTSRDDEIKISSQQDDIKIHPEEPEKIVPAAEVKESDTEKTAPVESEAADAEPIKLERFKFFRGDEDLGEEDVVTIRYELEDWLEGRFLTDYLSRQLEAGLYMERVKDRQDDGTLARAIPDHLLAANRRNEIAALAKKIGRSEISLQEAFETAERESDVRQLTNLKVIGLRLLQDDEPIMLGWSDRNIHNKKVVLLGQMMAQRTEAAMLNIKIQQGNLKEAVPVKNARQFAASFWKAAQDRSLPEEHRQRLKEVATKLVEEYQDEPGFNVIIQPATGKNENTATAMQSESPPSPEEPVEQKTVETPLADQYPERAKFNEQARQFNEQAKGQETTAREIEAVEQGGHLPAWMKEELHKTLAENASLSRETGHYIDRLEYDLDYGRNLAGKKRLSAMFNRIGMRMQVAGGIHSPRFVGDKNSGFWQEVKDYFKAVRAIFSQSAQQRVITARQTVVEGFKKMATTNTGQANEVYSRLAGQLEEINGGDKARQVKMKKKRE